MKELDESITLEDRRHQRRATRMLAITARLNRQVEQRKLGSAERLTRHVANEEAYAAARAIAAQEQQKALEAQQRALEGLDSLVGR